MTDTDPLDDKAPRPVATGTTTYYLDRLADFRRRWPEASPPSYYADYGNKCLGQFLSTKPILSPRGQRWIDDTLQRLQQMMEQERRHDGQGFAAKECDDDTFREFAFGTHAQAYQDAGVFELGVADLWKIVRTPDLKDLLNDEGRKEVGRLVLGRDGVNPAGPGALAFVARSNRRLRSALVRLSRRAKERIGRLPKTGDAD